jgi:pyruvate dehydrogenase E1 component alpha subunit
MDSVAGSMGAGPAGTALVPSGKPDADACERMYRTMVTITVADIRIRTEARAGRLRAACYPVHGLEGVCGAG